MVLETFDNQPIISDNLTHKPTLDIFIDLYFERILLFITQLGNFFIFLKILWL